MISPASCGLHCSTHLDKVSLDPRQQFLCNLPPGGDTVGDVGEEVSTFKLDKISEDGRLKKLTVELGDTIDLERSDNSEECHPDVFGRALLDNRHSGDAVCVIWPSLGDLTQEFMVDSVDDLEMSR